MTCTAAAGCFLVAGTIKLTLRKKQGRKCDQPIGVTKLLQMEVSSKK